MIIIIVGLFLGCGDIDCGDPCGDNNCVNDCDLLHEEEASKEI